ncbi:DUF3597 domain-containing protein [uncultured Enterovirga sp.]|uniref:DUF3597 domain-containing protein n=1 Tax=uncultured Enterovirga sp. TaxID=2026352 RepID=UPI0035CA2D78
MSIFGSIMSKIFGTEAKAEGSSAASGTAGGTSGATATASVSPGGTTAKPGGAVDVEAIMTDLAAKSGRPSNWRVSIVDLMTLLNLDSSLANRKELAKELGYTGDTNDSATMNIWLHKQVMHKLAENGGKVPDNIKNA